MPEPQALELDKSSEANSTFDLVGFFPYQTRVFYRHVFDIVSRVYMAEYEMKPHEWRTIAILGGGHSLTSAEIVERSSMDKVTVSRAVAGLRKRGWLVELTNRNDGRSKVLKLSKAGRDVFQDLVPKMLKIEQDILSPLSPDEADELLRLMKKVRNSEDK
ncbi:MAG: MarR family winged helix-turn-helix transcriptional regulator [Sulfitobacter sp.]